MERKVQELLARLPKLEEALGDPGVFSDKNRYKELTREHAYLSDVQRAWTSVEKARTQLEENKQMLADERDPEFVEVLQQEIASLTAKLPEMETTLQNLLIPPDPTDHRNTIMELRAGTGGDEASLFVGDCVRMYKLFADSQGWTWEELSSSESELGGYKEYVMVLSGPNVYRRLKWEGGTHRVQRVPATETQGRVHTSAITVAVLPEPDEEEEIHISESDLRIDTYRSSGAGGQHVNTTDSAVRITHLPTNTVCYCSEERSQIKNRAKAMRLLQAKLVEAARFEREQEIRDNRASQVGSGDRSERIRTYNFSQNRITDHRIDLTQYNLDRVMNGELASVVDALVAHFHQKKLEDR